MKNWTAHKTNNVQGTDFREVRVNGKISELQFTIKPHVGFWRAGFKLVDPNSNILPPQSDNSLLFHLGSTPSNQEYGFTAYLNGVWIKELNKTRKYPIDRLLTIRLEVNHNNFLKVFVNGSIEFKPVWHLKNPNIREKIVLIAWGDESDYKVDFMGITAANWRTAQKDATNKLIFYKRNIFSFFKNLTNPQKFTGALFLGIILIIIGKAINPLNVIQTYINSTQAPSIELQPTPSVTSTPDTTSNSINIDQGKSFIDPVSGVTVGVNWVLYRDFSNLTITFPEKTSEEYQEVKSGMTFKFLGKDRLSYTLTIVEIGYESIGIRVDLNPN